MMCSCCDFHSFRPPNPHSTNKSCVHNSVPKCEEMRRTDTAAQRAILMPPSTDEGCTPGCKTAAVCVVGSFTACLGSGIGAAIGAAAKACGAASCLSLAPPACGAIAGGIAAPCAVCLDTLAREFGQPPAHTGSD